MAKKSMIAKQKRDLSSLLKHIQDVTFVVDLTQYTETSVFVVCV